MPGLMPDPEEQMHAGAPQGDPEEQGETVPDDEGAEQATPEEQAKYEEFVKTGYGLMYAGGKVNPHVMKMLDDDPSDLMSVLQDQQELQQFSPVVALAATAAIITLETCKKTGEKDGTIILHGGKAILEDLVEIAEKAGIHEFSEDDMMQAMRMGADLFREAGKEAGIVNEDEAKQEWGEIQTADQEGKLGDVLPALANVKEAPDEAAPQDQGMPGG